MQGIERIKQYYQKRPREREKSVGNISKKIFICDSIVRYCLMFSRNLVDPYDDVIRRGNNLVRS